ncbi:PLAC8 family-domain-containing protein [Cladorrhinum samala]|uniref:PLAC8 family-domain-containing protein n=1 Tax=Cladorrhinum samala TaxID=585594 RepID=A0AAV9HYD0_9PEZI|nr:PLAC8 family-domain-containing protein [Cladorrhinum samala]
MAVAVQAVTPAKTQEWSNGLCDCGPCDLCMLGCCCPCILVGKSATRMNDPSMQSYETVNGDCMIFLGINCVSGCGWIYGMLKRQEIRERFGIKGSGTNDCCVSYWCSCCALIQQEKEVQARMSSTVPVTQGYQPEKQGMQMPGQQ